MATVPSRRHRSVWITVPWKLYFYPVSIKAVWMMQRKKYVQHGLLSWYLFCLLVVLVKLSVLAKWLAGKTPLMKPNRGEGIVSIKPRLKSVYDFLGLLYCVIVKSLQITNQHTTFYRPDVLPVAQLRVLKHWREKLSHSTYLFTQISICVFVHKRLLGKVLPCLSWRQ